ncbi:hypothetical protein L1889_18330 [Paenalcaligenes niemegkensis]|uniref:hypothetical protein n=1 Tax=Paenalcaligenes niemegkensis TaxID=2895469 RepID=UPI001EE987EF|nr:hypothetical protein [Paenalcaligenes niemegkensis]MCQ9618398.1 hypothetical protein [Paenalcaligenes niemegkensis]
MALRINQTDPAAIGERWEDYQDDISFKIGGIDDENYQIALERARRLISREDAAQSLHSITATTNDRREHDIQCQLLGHYIVRDWKGEILDDNDRFVPYSPEAAAKLLKANVELFAWVVTQATKVAVDKNAEVAETVGKPSPDSNGSASGRAKPKSKV